MKDNDFFSYFYNATAESGVWKADLEHDSDYKGYNSIGRYRVICGLFKVALSSGQYLSETQTAVDLAKIALDQIKRGKLVIREIDGIEIFYNGLFNGYNKKDFNAKYGQSAADEVDFLVRS